MSADTSILYTLSAGWASAMGRACWQGGLAFLIAWALGRLLPRLSGRAQCWLWRLAYLKLLVALLWAAPLRVPLLSPSAPSVRAGSGTEKAPRPALHPAVGFASNTETVSWPAPVAPPARSHATEWLLLAWLLGAGWSSTRVLADWHRTQRLRREGQPVQDMALLAECGALCHRYGARREPLLLAAPDLGGPVLVSALRPTIILPAWLIAQLSAAQVHLILAHELAHMKRRDLWWALLPNLARVLFFFHPLVWLAEGQWRLAQEMACDELAVLSTGASRSCYGAVLLEVMGRLPSPRPSHLLAAGIAELYATVKRRLVAIRRVRPVSPRRAALAALWLGAAGMIGIVPWQVTVRADRDRSTAARSTPETGASAAERPERLRGSGPRLRKDASKPPSRRPAPSRAHPNVSPSAHLVVTSRQPPDRSNGARAFDSIAKDRPIARATAKHAGVSQGALNRTVRSLPLRLASMPPRPRVEAPRPQPGTSDVTLPPGVQDSGVDDNRLRHPPGGENGAVASPEKASAVPESAPVAVPPSSGAEDRPLVLLLLKKPGGLDPTGLNLRRLAAEKRMAVEKQMAAAGILHLPKPVLAPSAGFGWRPSPLFTWTRRVKHPTDGSIDPRVWKKWLALAREEFAVEGKQPSEKLSLAANKALFYQHMDELKRRMARGEKVSDDPAASGR